jgi:hypothetical protein
MTLPPLPLTDGAFVIDNSGLELLQTCNRAHQYNRLNKRILAAGKPALDFGTAMHLALEWRYKNCKNEGPGLFDEEDQVALVKRFFDEHPVPEDDFRNVNFAVELIKHYNSRYSIEPFNVMEYDVPMDCGHCEGKGMTTIHEGQGIPCLMCRGTGKNSIMCELPFVLPLHRIDDTPVLYSGRIDLPVTWDGQLIVIDHKTTSMIGPTYFEEAKLSAQQIGYAWAFGELTGQKVEGYCINAMRSKEIPQYVLAGKSYKGITAEQWWEESLQRDTVYLRNGQLEEWKNNTISLVEEFFWHYSKDYLPMKTKWCFGKFGKCPYFDVCVLPPEQRDMMLASDRYQDNNWSPLIRPSKQTT